MKIKMKYLYIVLFLVIVLSIIFSINSNRTNSNLSGQKAAKISADSQMPTDEIHTKLSTTVPKPNKNNVSKNIIHEMEMLKKQIEKVPNDTLTMKKYADLLFASHKQSEAINYYKRILKIDKKRKDIYLNLVFAYYKLRDLENAELFTKKLIKYYPNDLVGQYNLGAIYASQGKKADATSIWKNIIAKSPNSEQAKLAKSSLDKLNQ